MMETSKISEVVEKLKSGVFRLIGIDGADGSGKSTLASQLASELGFVHLNLDDYIERNQGLFVPHIKYDEVRRQIDRAEEPVVLEGVCLLAILYKLSMQPDLFIYVKRISSHGYWHDEDDCDVQGNIDELIAVKKEELLKFGQAEASIEGREFNPSECKFPELDEKLIRYHHEFMPHKKAEVIFKRVD